MNVNVKKYYRQRKAAESLMSGFTVEVIRNSQSREFWWLRNEHAKGCVSRKDNTGHKKRKDKVWQKNKYEQKVTIENKSTKWYMEDEVWETEQKMRGVWRLRRREGGWRKEEERKEGRKKERRKKAKGREEEKEGGDKGSKGWKCAQRMLSTERGQWGKGRHSQDMGKWDCIGRRTRIGLDKQSESKQCGCKFFFCLFVLCMREWVGWMHVLNTL